MRQDSEQVTHLASRVSLRDIVGPQIIEPYFNVESLRQLRCCRC